MPKWIKIIIAISIPLVVSLIVVVWSLVKIGSSEPVIFNLRPDINLQFDEEVFTEVVAEAKKINPNFGLAKIVIVVSPFYKETINGAGVRGTTFMYTEWGQYLKVPVLKVYFNKKRYDNLDTNMANESFGYFLIRQTLINQGIAGDENNRISYKYGISKPQLFLFRKVF